MSLSAFLERVDELRIARNVSLEMLFDSAIDLFRGKALIWFRAYRSSVTDWDGLTKLLREEFQPYDYNEKLLEEIKRRSQGPDESLGVYVAIMQSMFNRLDVTLSQTTRVKILMKNIAPFYQDKLSLTTVSTIDELLKLGRQLEARKSALEEFKPPPRRGTSKLLEPDLAYVYSDQGTQGNSKQSQCASVGRDFRCFNCKESGHLASRCTKPFRRHCFRCGEPNVTTRSCPICMHQGNESRGQQ